MSRDDAYLDELRRQNIKSQRMVEMIIRKNSNGKAAHVPWKRGTETLVLYMTEDSKTKLPVLHYFQTPRYVCRRIDWIMAVSLNRNMLTSEWFKALSESREESVIVDAFTGKPSWKRPPSFRYDPSTDTEFAYFRDYLQGELPFTVIVRNGERISLDNSDGIYVRRGIIKNIPPCRTYAYVTDYIDETELLNALYDNRQFAQ